MQISELNSIMDRPCNECPEKATKTLEWIGLNNEEINGVHMCNQHAITEITLWIGELEIEKRKIENERH